MSRVRLKLTFLLLGGGTAESSGGLADTVYMVSSRSAMESVVEQEVSELGLVLYRERGSGDTRSVVAPYTTNRRDTDTVLC